VLEGTVNAKLSYYDVFAEIGLQMGTGKRHCREIGKDFNTEFTENTEGNTRAGIFRGIGRTLRWI
jgi:hypothetical protein